MNPGHWISAGFLASCVIASLAASAACGSDKSTPAGTAGTGWSTGGGCGSGNGFGGSGGTSLDGSLSGGSGGSGGTSADSGKSYKSAKSNLPRTLDPAVSSSNFQALVDGNTAFALDLYGYVRAKPGNFMLSPYSASVALAMVYAGARGTSETQIASALHFTLPQAALHPAFDKLDLQLMALNQTADPATGEGFQLNLANSMWAAENMTLRSEFLDTLAVNYGTGVFLTDFAGNPQGARADINTWVADETQQRILDLMPPDSVGKETRMVVVNAMYLRASWKDPFNEAFTKDMPFHALSGDVSVPMMVDSQRLLCTEGDGFKVGELPYQGYGAVMTVIVPDLGRYDEIEGQVTPAWLKAADASMQMSEVDLRMPKFGFTFGTLSLRAALQAMGMVDPFGDLADFSGMTPENVGIGDVLHKTFISVDENGTEAAAATAVGYGGGGGGGPGPMELYMDRPFLFLIREKATGTILFMGRFMGP